jgi:hypothetical protein
MRAKRSAIVFLAAANFLIAFLAAAPLSPSLGRALDDRPIAGAVADAADDGPRAELLEDHPEISAIAIETGFLAVALWWISSWIFVGGILSEEFLVGCARHWKRMLAVGALGTLLRLPALIGPLVSIPIFSTAKNFPGLLAGSLVALAVGGLFWSLATVTIDRASGIAIREPSLSAWRALRTAARATRTNFPQTLQVALLSGCGFLALAGLQILITQSLPATALGSLFGVLTAMAGALLRAGLSVYVVLAAQLSPKTPG